MSRCPGETLANESWLWSRVRPESGLPPPTFAVVRRQPDGGRQVKLYDPAPSPGQTQWSFPADSTIEWANLTYDGGDRWTLAVKAKSPSGFPDSGPANEIWFPYQDPLRPSPLPPPLAADARVYYGFRGGLVQTEADSLALGRYTWGPMQLPYPGGSSSPVLILADSSRALLIAAVNDPPRLTDMRHSGGQTAFIFDSPEMLRASGDSVRVLLSEAHGDAAGGYHPWQIAAQRYKDWLDGVYPRPSYPGWMECGEGFLNVQLQNYTSPLTAEPHIEGLWSRWKDHFGWIQLWGQMSNYAGPPELADPPLEPGEEVGCCLRSSKMHPRYAPWLPAFVKSQTSKGYRAGFYTREGLGTVETESGRDSIADWLARNGTEYNANAFYIDVIGAAWNLGSPSAVQAFLSSPLVPRSTMIEGWVDIYPNPPLISGYIAGTPGWPGGPQVDQQAATRYSFPNLSRFLMGNRIAYLGESNGEHVSYGPANGHWLERQIFLLGAKADVISPEIDGQANRRLRWIKSLRDASGWWALRPRYVDTVGLTQVPPGVTARRFISGSLDLIAIDNPARLAGQTFLLRGRPYAVPPAELSVVRVNRDAGNEPLLEDVISCGIGLDCGGNILPDECDTDYDADGIPDACDPAPGPGRDCDESSLQLPSDCNQDGALDISDAICLLGHLFLGAPAAVPCDGGTVLDSGNAALLDANGDGTVDLSDAVRVLGHLFAGSPPPLLGKDCMPIAGCPDNAAKCGS